MLLSLGRCAVRTPRCSSHAPLRSFTSASLRSRQIPTLPPKAFASGPKPVERTPIERVNMLAKKMIDSGRSEIYKNTASTGFLFSAYSIMTLSYVSIGYIYSTRFWEPETTNARGLHWAVPVAYQIGMIGWGIFAAYSFSRTLGLVKSIRLVQNAGRVQLETSIRRIVPFVRPERVLTEPATLVVNRRKLFAAGNAEGMIVASDGQSFLTRISRTLFYNPFHNTRKVMGGVGLVPIQVGEPGSKRYATLDVDGTFSNGGQDILELSKDED